MNAARSVEEDQNSVDPKYIAKAASMAKWSVSALALLVLHAVTKCLVVSAQVEWGNANRTMALLSSASTLRNIVCVSLLRDAYEVCDALHRLLCSIYEGMDDAKSGINISRAVQTALSVTLIFAEQIFAPGSPELATILDVRQVLGSTALCAFAALNTSYHSGKVRYSVSTATSPTRSFVLRRPCKSSRTSGINWMLTRRKTLSLLS